MCLTETQKRVANIKKDGDIKGIGSMREEREQKGGRLIDNVLGKNKF